MDLNPTSRLTPATGARPTTRTPAAADRAADVPEGGTPVPRDEVSVSLAARRAAASERDTAPDEMDLDEANRDALVEDLRRQVESGTYSLDAASLARRMRVRNDR